MKAIPALVPFLFGRRSRALEQARARDWTVVAALCMGVVGLVLMFMMFWL